MLLQVHDELIFECPEDEISEVSRLAMDKMSNAYRLKVPLKTEARAGVNWGKMKPLEV
jgi:DNA polymerase-1